MAVKTISEVYVHSLLMCFPTPVVTAAEIVERSNKDSALMSFPVCRSLSPYHNGPPPRVFPSRGSLVRESQDAFF